MTHQIDPSFREELSRFGKQDWNECFHCGNCTAICQLTDRDELFPRKDIRFAQMGLRKKVESSVDPWLCYYCGECTDTCPRDANPGEMMMSMRRYLTSSYDITGISKLFYKSHLWEIGVILFMALAIIVSYMYFLPLRSDYAQMLNTDGGVMINSLASGYSSSQFVNIIHYGDWIMAFLVGGLLIINIFNMFYKVILRDKNTKVSVITFIKEAWSIVFHFGTQAKFSKCDDKKKYWLGHLLLMTGYTTMFIIIVAFLPQFQIEEIKPWWHWQRFLGYYATFGILFFLSIVAVKRIQRSETNLRFSHPSDWIFIIMLALTTITGIVLHVFRLQGMVAASYYMYIFHLAVLVPMIVIEVPFSKWSHLAYRPFAIYFSRVKRASKKRAQQLPELATI